VDGANEFLVVEMPTIKLDVVLLSFVMPIQVISSISFRRAHSIFDLFAYTE